MKVITIINQYSGNKGDRAVCYYVLRELLKYPGIVIYLSTNDRNNWKNERIVVENNIHLIPWGWNVEGFDPQNRIHWEKRRFLRIFGFPFLINRILKGKKDLSLGKFFVNREFYQAVKLSNAVISTGGHHLTTRFAPNLTNELFFDICVSLLLNSNVYLWSQTFGPFIFTDKKRQKALQSVLNSCRKIYIRDIESFNVLKTLHINSLKLYKTYESVIGLNYLIENFILPSKRDNIIGITIYNAEHRSNQDYKKYCESIALISGWLIEQKFIVKFFPHEIIGATINDRGCINDIVGMIERKDDIFVEDQDYPIEYHLKEIAKCKIFVGHKTHSVIFALTVGTPLIAISYHPKTIDFLRQYSLEKNVINDANLNLEHFKEKFNGLLPYLDDIGIHQFEESRKLSRVISNDFKQIIEEL